VRVCIGTRVFNSTHKVHGGMSCNGFFLYGRSVWWMTVILFYPINWLYIRYICFYTLIQRWKNCLNKLTYNKILILKVPVLKICIKKITRHILIEMLVNIFRRKHFWKSREHNSIQFSFKQYTFFSTTYNIKINLKVVLNL